MGVFQTALQAVQWGVRGCRPEMDMAVLLGRKAEVMAGLRQGLASSLARAKVTLLRGQGRVPALGSVAVRTEAGESLHAARNILLCLGSEPSIPPIPGIGQPGVMTSDQILDLDRVPRSLIIIGAGVIGLEFAGIYSGLGSTVTVLEAAPRILPMLDSDLAGRLLPLWKRQGVRLVRGVSVSSIERGDGGGFLVRANGRPVRWRSPGTPCWRRWAAGPAPCPAWWTCPAWPWTAAAWPWTPGCAPRCPGSTRRAT